MKAVLIAALLTMAAAQLAIATPPEINETSPDKKWRFEAHWYAGDLGAGDGGYLWQLENLRTKKVFYARSGPGKDEILPARVSALWSPDSRYVAINFYYGRIAFDFAVIPLFNGTPKDSIKNLRDVNPLSMIKAEDRKRWNGEGTVNSAARSWQASPTASNPPATDWLEVTFSMRGGLKSEKSNWIDFWRDQLIQFTGLTARIVRDDPPQDDEEPEQ